MMKYFVALLSAFALLQMVTARPSAPSLSAITKDIRVELPGSERINKRAVEDYVETAEIPADIPSNDDSQEDADYNSSESGSPVGETEALESDEEFAAAESNIIFRPLFVSRQRSVNRNRPSRSTDALQRAHKRSLNKNEEESADAMEVAENGMVFLPLFRSRNRFTESRFRRSAEGAPKTKNPVNVIETDDGLVGAEDVIFKPDLRRKLRPVRSITEEKSLRSDVDDMEIAENGLIFRPLFRTRQRDTSSV